MAAYTLHITANPKHFDPAHADIVQMIRKLAVGICVKCWRANNIKVNGNERRYQAWREHASKGNNWKLLQRMDKYYKSLWEGSTWKSSAES